jgi:hypothetical protein
MKFFKKAFLNFLYVIGNSTSFSFFLTVISTALLATFNNSFASLLDYEVSGIGSIFIEFHGKYWDLNLFRFLIINTYLFIFLQRISRGWIIF